MGKRKDDCGYHKLEIRRTKSRMSEIIEIAAQARQIGVSYGAYVSGCPGIQTNNADRSDPTRIVAELPDHELFCERFSVAARISYLRKRKERKEVEHGIERSQNI